MPEVGVSEEGVCCKIIFLKSLMIRSSNMKFCENRHEALIFLKLFVCNQFFCLVETVVVCQKNNSCLCIIFVSCCIK